MAAVAEEAEAVAAVAAAAEDDRRYIINITGTWNASLLLSRKG